MNKKIVIISNTASGLVSFRKELVEVISKKYDLTILVSDMERADELSSFGCKVIPTVFDRQGKNPFHDLALLKTYKTMMKTIKPDIVFTYTIKPNIYGGLACAGLKIPYVANITGLGAALEYPGIMQKITIPLYRMGLKKAKKVFFQNTENCDFMLRHKMVKSDYEVIPGSGVNLTQYTPLEYPNGETIDFAFISRIRKEKGIDQYLEAAQYIREKYPNTRFHVCGGCETDYEPILDDLQKKGVIIYHGKISDIAGMHRISQCTIHPTYYPEGMSNVLLESCACARPIITTDRAGCREIVDDGKNGFIVKQKDAADLIEKIEKFLHLSEEERKQMGLMGREKVEREFDRNIIVKKYLDEIEAIK